MSPEALLAGGYCFALLICALALEWLSAHTHRRSLRYRTAGFDYHAGLDHWTCPEGEYLLPEEVDHERRLVRYRALSSCLQPLPAEAALHRLRPRARDRTAARPVAALGGGALSSGDLV